MEVRKFFQFTGNERININDLVTSVRNSFSYELWVKPEAEIVIDSESKKGVSGISGQKYVISPGHGGTPFQAGTGLSIGKNGIAVYEHTDSHMPATLVHPLSCTEWTHIAIVFHDKTPYLYINGKFAKRGLKSTRENIFPSCVFGGHTPYGAYVGKVKEIRIWDHARDAEQIRQHWNRELAGSQPGLFGCWKLTGSPVVKDLSSYKNTGYVGWGNYAKAVEKGNHQFACLIKEQVVDIVVPIYNSLDYLKNCLDSVFKYTDLPYNLVLIDDCSTDPEVGRYLKELEAAEKPANLNDLVIILNEKNQGFTRNANMGMANSENNVVLLNSDTVVPKGWLRRLLAPFGWDEQIASVTPFSNNASICSFPVIDRENPMPNNLTVDEVDAVFRKFSTNAPIPLPCGVGFCMAFNRKALKQIGLFDAETFGTGYCEENDWCQRAYHAGFSNVLIPNLFVYHKMGASFRPLIGYGREEQIRQNYQKLLGRYPNFTEVMEKFVSEDPAKFLREELTGKLACQQTNLKVSCILTSYNRPKNVVEAINSVKGQTYSNWELIIVDDNSNEETKLTLKKEAEKDARIKLIQSGVKNEDRHKTTRYASCINLAIPHITGDLVTYLTDDDLYYPQRFEKMVQKFVENPEVFIVYGKQRVIYTEGTPIKTFINYFKAYYPNHWFDYISDGKYVREFIRPNISVTRYPMFRVDHNSFMHRRVCFEKVNAWDDDPAYWTHADLKFFEKLVQYWDFHPVDFVTDEHRIHPEGIQEKLGRGEKPWGSG